MDIVAHTLWAAVGVAAVRRHRPVGRGTAAAALLLAALPDLVHLLPIVAWWLGGDGSFAALRAYVAAAPGEEPALPDLVALASHHLHCVMHSAPVALLATVLAWVLFRGLWLPLLGWWSHIVIDVFTHSADYYAVPVLYPFTERGFDGIAWNTPGLIALNYAALAVAAVWLRAGRPGR